MDPLYPPTSTAAAPKGLFSFDGQLERYFEKDLLTSVFLSRRSSDLLQNCDLPPPLNIFSPIKKDAAAAQVDKTRQQASPTKWDGDDHGSDDSNLLRALRLSQTRAREAERKAALARTRNEQISALLLEESLALSAHQRWVKLLEAEISALQQRKKSRMLEPPPEQGDEAALPAVTAAWCLAIALCLGIAGVGFALGRCRL